MQTLITSFSKESCNYLRLNKKNPYPFSTTLILVKKNCPSTNESLNRPHQTANRQTPSLNDNNNKPFRFVSSEPLFCNVGMGASGKTGTGTRV